MEVRLPLKGGLLSLILMGCQAGQTNSKHTEDQKDAEPRVESPKLNRLLGNYFDDTLRLSPVNADSPTTSQTVNCMFKWRPSEEVDAQIKQGGFVALPLYETRDRTTVLAELLVPCSSSDVETWMLSWASFFTN